MIKIESRATEETRNFKEVFGVSIDALKTCKIFIQGDYLSGFYSPSDDGKVISIYCKNFAAIVLPKNQEGYDIQEVKIKRGDFNVCRDLEFPARNTIAKKYIDEIGTVLAVVDCYGNIHFIDFIHRTNEGKIFLPVFFEILKQEKHPLIEEWWELYCEQEVAKKIYPEVLRAVKELGVARRAKAVVEGELQNQHAIQISILSKEIEKLKQEAAKRAEKEIWGAFLEGVALSGSKNWKINGNEIEYTKKIIAKHIKGENEIVEAPKNKYYISGLTIFYSPDDQIRASAKESFHPNVSDSGSVCMGDIKKESEPLLENLKRIKLLPQVLQTINLDSSYDGDAKSKAWDDWARTPQISSEVFDLTITT